MGKVSATIRQELAELGARKAVAELHPELHAEFRAQWPAMDDEAAKDWIEALGTLKDADCGPYSLGLRKAREMGCEELAGRHPAQVEVLKDIPAEDRSAVESSAHLMQNLVGGIFSGCLWSAAQQYRRVGLEEMQRRDRLSNARAMGWAVDEDGYRIA